MIYLSCLRDSFSQVIMFPLQLNLNPETSLFCYTTIIRSKQYTHRHENMINLLTEPFKIQEDHIHMRLDKLLSHAGYGSRKDVKALVKKGRVSVDQHIVTNSGMHVDPSKHCVTVDNNVVHYEQFIYLMLHKPQGYLTATKDAYQKTVLDLIPDEFNHFHLFPVGRLDKDTEGLLIITNDGLVNHQLTSPNREIFKTYYATIDGCIKKEHIQQFKDGIVLDDGYKTKSARLHIITSANISEVELSICEGKFQQVKRMFEAIGMRVTYLKRLSMGEIHLDHSLRLGEVRRLNEKELEYITTLKNYKEG